jgi:hypothetical protein
MFLGEPARCQSTEPSHRRTSSALPAENTAPLFPAAPTRSGPLSLQFLRSIEPNDRRSARFRYQNPVRARDSAPRRPDRRSPLRRPQQLKPLTPPQRSSTPQRNDATLRLRPQPTTFPPGSQPRPYPDQRHSSGPKAQQTSRPGQSAAGRPWPPTSRCASPLSPVPISRSQPTSTVQDDA